MLDVVPSDPQGIDCVSELSLDVTHQGHRLPRRGRGKPAQACRPARLDRVGANDFAFREPERVRFDATFSNHRTLVFEDASHFLHEAVGDRIVDAYRRIRWHSTFERL